MLSGREACSLRQMAGAPVSIHRQLGLQLACVVIGGHHTCGWEPQHDGVLMLYDTFASRAPPL